MEFKNALASVAVRDFAISTTWYSKLFGREPDQTPMDNFAEYSFPGGGWLQVFVDEARAGQSTFTLAVQDLAVAIVDAGNRGVEAADTHHGDFVSTSILRDPDGNRIVLAEARSPDNKSVA